ncbi:hypothetical protein D043_0282A, partial [Vibrio parahaemolyticus EKP-021]
MNACCLCESIRILV